MAERYVG